MDFVGALCLILLLVGWCFDLCLHALVFYCVCYCLYDGCVAFRVVVWFLMMICLIWWGIIVAWECVLFIYLIGMRVCGCCCLVYVIWLSWCTVVYWYYCMFVVFVIFAFIANCSVCLWLVDCLFVVAVYVECLQSLVCDVAIDVLCLEFWFCVRWVGCWFNCGLVVRFMGVLLLVYLFD